MAWKCCDILPKGKSAILLSSPVCKNILVHSGPKSPAYLWPSRAPCRAYRDRHGRWAWDAVDASGAADESTLIADGEVVWAIFW
jgi:hypothetical protein